MVTVIDEDLLAHERIWAAAGHPSAVFPLTPDELVRLTGGQVARTA
jgi:prolyl-tRNA editing enzyme YbaK/EbsC (Cys-tRNA(Pro) deacylase)